MSVRVGIISAAHVHAPSFANCLKNHPAAELVGITDSQAERGSEFASRFEIPFFSDQNDLISQVDAVVIASENMNHKDHIAAGIAAGKHVLCEKPIAPNAAHADEIDNLISGSKLTLATAFPCPFSPNYLNAESRILNGDLGKILAFSTTNQGRCPHSWFVDPAQSGGGAMIDHVVHVSDLLRRLLGEDPLNVQAQIGNKMYGLPVDDIAMVTVQFGSGAFATIDSSWSKPANYPMWGNVNLNIIGEKGVVELDLFSQGVATVGPNGAGFAGSGSNLDALMMADFISAIENGHAPKSTLADGLWASRIAIAAYKSVANQGQPAAV